VRPGREMTSAPRPSLDDPNRLCRDQRANSHTDRSSRPRNQASQLSPTGVRDMDLRTTINRNISYRNLQT
jgi:hypothetical protein